LAERGASSSGAGSKPVCQIFHCLNANGTVVIGIIHSMLAQLSVNMTIDDQGVEEPATQLKLQVFKRQLLVTVKENTE
jgi:hypothetical protein